VAVDFIPSERDVAGLLRQTGALRDGHFVCPSGFHSNQFLETALAMRSYRNAKALSVGLSRLLRADPELRAVIPELSIVAATPAGLPVAYGVCEALRARQVYWAEKPAPGQPMRFPQFFPVSPGEKVVLVDDLLRSGALIHEARELLEKQGARVMALAVMVYQPGPMTRTFGALPLYYLARLEVNYYADPASCELCRRGLPPERIGKEPLEQALEAYAFAGTI
jgi:orotate phosphoribosyltransferase